MSNRRRATDHPWDGAARLALGTIFGVASVGFGVTGATMPMAVFLVACGAMMRINIASALNRLTGPKP